MENDAKKLGMIHAAACKALDSLNNFPCRMDEMTPRELEIANIACGLVGTLQFIRDNSEVKEIRRMNEHDCGNFDKSLVEIKRNGDEWQLLIDGDPTLTIEFCPYCGERLSPSTAKA